jgi:hypothetical protein
MSFCLRETIRRADCGKDSVDYAVHACEHLEIPEPQYMILHVLQLDCPNAVLLDLIRMLAAIKLDDQPVFLTAKISDI